MRDKTKGNWTKSFTVNKSKRKLENSNPRENLYLDNEVLDPKATEDQFALFAQKVLSKFSSTPSLKAKNFINDNIKRSVIWKNETSNRMKLNSQLTKIRIKSNQRK